MRILQLGPYPPPHGGVQTNLAAIHRALRTRGALALVANITRTRREDADGVYYPNSAFELVWLLTTRRYDVVHLHLGGHLSPRLLALCFLCTLLPRRATVVTLHSGGYPSSPAGRTARRWTLRGFVFRRVDRIIIVNDEMRGLFARFGVQPNRLRLIAPHASLTLDANQSVAQLNEDIRRFAGEHRPLLATVGGLEPEYDIELQLRTLPRIRRAFPGAGLIIVGGGSQHEQIRRAISESGVSTHVLLCGDTPHDQTLQLIASSDVLLRTTHYDGDSIAVREALALGTPVVATDNGMRPSGVYRFPVGDSGALSEAVAAAIEGGRRPPADDREEDNIKATLDVYSELLGTASVALLAAGVR